MDTLKEKLLIYAKNNLNVMFVGRHGIGKTTIVSDIADYMKMHFKYFSTPTLDPYSAVIGVPVPDNATKTVEFFRSKDWHDVEFLFFDEMNRAQNDRILDAILEIVQFKSINGEKLPNLKMVWAAINPPGEYKVIELDPALEDRFHMYVRLQAEINMEYMCKKMRAPIAKVIKDWWDIELNDEQRKVMSPRRMEYIGCMIDAGIPWRDAIPVGSVGSLPIHGLDKRLSAMIAGREDFVITKENVLNRIDELVQRLDKEPQLAIGLSDLLSSRFSETELFDCRDIINKFPTELVEKVISGKWVGIQRNLMELFTQNNINLTTEYPKILKALRNEIFEGSKAAK